MFDRIRDPNVRLIYLATFFVGVAYGLSISVVSLFLDGLDYGDGAIGKVAAWYAGGIVLFALPSGWFVKKFGGRRVLLASLFGYAIACIAFPFAETFEAFAGIRFVDGAFSVGIWVCCETLLLIRAEASQKAFAMSLYAISLGVGYVMGPFFATLLSGPDLHWAFLISGGFATVSGLLVLFRLDPDPPDTAQSDRRADGGQHTSALTLIWKIKASCLATFSYGYFQTAAVVFLPLYLYEERGISRQFAPLVPAFFAAGMLLFSNVAGRLGDRYGHLLLMRTLAALGVLTILGFRFVDNTMALWFFIFASGATFASISPVSLAFQSHVIDRGDYIRANAIYNLFYASGMLTGPIVAGYLKQAFSGNAMLMHFVGLWGIFVVFCTVFAKDDPRAGARKAARDASRDRVDPAGPPSRKAQELSS